MCRTKRLTPQLTLNPLKQAAMFGYDLKFLLKSDAPVQRINGTFINIMISGLGGTSSITSLLKHNLNKSVVTMAFYPIIKAGFTKTDLRLK